MQAVRTFLAIGIVAQVAMVAALAATIGLSAAGWVVGVACAAIMNAALARGVRRYRTNLRQDFHTDGADVIGLLCLRAAQSGGESRIASSFAVYNELLARRPDLLEELYRPMPWDRNGEQSAGEPAFFELAPFHDVDGVPRVFYIGWYIRDAQRHPEAPRLTEAQREAMDLLEAIANDPAFHVEMDFRPGDIQMLNNARILHSREAFTDPADPGERRHLLRLWLRATEFADLEPFLRAGIAKRT